MQKRSIFGGLFGGKKQEVYGYKIAELANNSDTTFYAWDGKLFENDIVRAAIRPKTSAVSKLNPKHIRGEGESLQVNPEPYIKEILSFPNKYMSMQDLLTKLIFQREIYHNAFAYIKRDAMGYVEEIYPIPFSSVELLEKDNLLFARFSFKTGKSMTVPYEDLIHLRKDFNGHELFGETGYTAVKNIMEIINTTDQGIVKAIKNSMVIRWLLKFKNTLRPEDRDTEVEKFANAFLSVEKGNGVAATDPKYDAEQVKNETYIPNALQTNGTIQRLYSYFGVNDAIVQNKYNEDEWNSFYESEIEPIAIQLSNAFTRVFFTRRERGYGNKIIFEASNLQYASMKTKLNLMQMVDRGSMRPNEWRNVMNMGPIEGGDKPIRRLDTAVVDENKKEDETDGNKSA